MILEPEDEIRSQDIIVFEDNTQDYVSPDMVGELAGLYLNQKWIIEIRRYTDAW